MIIQALRTIQFIREKLEICDRKYVQGGNYIKKLNWYPTRLLHLSELGSDDKQRVKLINPAETQLDSPYVTFSHCWGGADIFKPTTETENLSGMALTILFFKKRFWRR